MRVPEERLQSAGEEERKKIKKRRRRRREDEEKTEEEGSAVVESARVCPRDTAEADLGLTSENSDEKKRGKKKKKKMKKKRDAEANEGSEGTTGREIEDEEGVKLAGTNDEREGKTNKKTSQGGVDEGIDAQRVESRKSEEVVKEPVESQETRERKKKNKSRKHLKSFEVGVLDNASGNQEGGLESKLEDRFEEHPVRRGDGECPEGTKTRRMKRDRSSEGTESFSERPVTEDERTTEEGRSRGSRDGKQRKKNLEEENNHRSVETKEKRAKDELTGHGNPISNNTSDRGFGTANEPTVAVKEIGVDDKKTEKKKKRKKKKNDEGTAEDNQSMNVREKSKMPADKETSSCRNLDDRDASATLETKKKGKKVNFSGHIEVFPSVDDARSNDQSSEDGLVQGKRFSLEEDEMIKQAVYNYIEENHLGEDGLNMVLNCKGHPELRNCWKKIGADLPWRPRLSVYRRAHTLFQRSESRKWEPEELDLVRRYYKEHGPKWKEMADLLGKHRTHVKDTWRRIKMSNAKQGTWAQEEYQTLFNLVNVDLQLKAFDEKKTKYGMLRENISWGAISKRLSTRHDAACCVKWYHQLTSPMVTQGLWADTDDYHLIDELLKLDACCIEDVEWDNLLENRSGELCLNRWKQMVRHIGGHKEKSFMEQVELLATRYCSHMLQYRTGNPKNCDESV